jgi:DnaJ-class molecular chaperone
MAKNYYDVLGVSRDSSEKDIRSAYRRLARQYHPDVNAGDKSAEAKFKEINEAYQVLSDADSRKKYDRFGDQWRHAGDFGRTGQQPGASPFEWFTRAGRRGQNTRTTSFGFGVIFGDLFGSKGEPFGEFSAAQQAEVAVNVTLEEAYSGTKRTVEIPGDAGSRRLEVSIPAGVRSGSKVHVGASQGVGSGLDLYLKVTIAEHRLFTWKGDDLLVTVDVPLADLMLGGEVEVPTIKGTKVALTVPAETQNGKSFRLRGKGMPRKSGKAAHGDELVTVKAVLPTNLTLEEREFFAKLRDSGKAPA